MICSICKVDKEKHDFINSNEICFRCIYQKKTEKTPQKRTKKTIACRVCDKQIIKKENLKKRQRTVFCSGECAEIGQKERASNHWTRQVRTWGLRGH